MRENTLISKRLKDTHARIINYNTRSGDQVVYLLNINEQMPPPIKYIDECSD